jgi:hypothetical protein
MHSFRNAAIILYCIIPAISIAQNLQCPDIARTLKTYQIDTSSSDFLNSVYSQNCQQDGSKKSSGGGIGIDTLVKSIPVKFTGNYNNTDEGFTNFCRTYKSLYAERNSQTNYKEYLSDRALITLNQCLALQAQGVYITHDVVNIESVAFYLRSSVTQSFDITGITTTGNINCSGQVKGRPAAFNKEVNLQVKATQSFSCIRGSETSANRSKIFDEASVIVMTNQGNYAVVLPRDERLAENTASTIRSEINTIRSDLSTSNTLLHTITDAKPIQVYQCPVGWTKGGGPGGPWASYGCLGQLSANPTCTDHVYPTSQNLNCTPLGSVRPY